ncbi:hypothetical protein DL95DRAFT_438474 [Leptodontidium sp. 2 PMI_412]|nr:hypothetical protein DL95DRAFT_438474 [Leptodontidium sp. 2 PMI_412]
MAVDTGTAFVLMVDSRRRKSKKGLQWFGSVVWRYVWVWLIYHAGWGDAITLPGTTTDLFSFTFPFSIRESFTKC